MILYSGCLDYLAKVIYDIGRSDYICETTGLIII